MAAILDFWSEEFYLFLINKWPDASYQVSSQLAQGIGGIGYKSNCWPHTPHNGHWPIIITHMSTSCSDELINIVNLLSDESALSGKG